jgi:membrane protein
MANKRIHRLLKILGGVNSSCNEDFFQLEGRLEQTTHFLVLVYRSFLRNRGFVRASALSYSTLLALIPLLAVALSVTSSLLKNQDESTLNHVIERFVSSVMPSSVSVTNSPAGASGASQVAATSGTNLMASGLSLTNGASGSGTNAQGAAAVDDQNEMSAQKEMTREIEKFVQNSSSGALGVTGMVFLIFTSISLLRGIEETFNDIWGITQGRSWRRQVVLYWAIITLGPVMMVGLSSGAYFQQTRNFMQSTPLLAAIYSQVLPIILMSLALALFYKVTPNTEVKTRPALVGGFVAGAAWHCYNQLGFLLVARATSASKIYGSLFLLVLLMGGLYIVWVILLLGAQIAYAFQNRIAYLQDKLAENVNHRGREFVALRLMTFIAQRFHDGARPATTPEISAELRIPSRLVQQVLRTLLGAQLVIEVSGIEAAYAPARPLHSINAWQILQAMRTSGGQSITCDDEKARRGVFGEFARIEDAEREAASSVTLISLLNQPAAPLTIGPEPEAGALEARPVLPLPEKVKVPMEAPPEMIQPVPAPMVEQLPVGARSDVKPEVEKKTASAQPGEERDFPL